MVVTANRLGDGAVVYRTPTAGWTTRLDSAAVVSTAPAAKELLTRRRPTTSAPSAPTWRRCVSINDGTVRPGNLRERIRLAGPTFDLPASFGI